MSGEELSLHEEIEAAFKDANAKSDDVSNDEVIDKLEKPAKEEPAKDEKVKEEPAKEEPAKDEKVKEEPAKEEPAKDEGSVTLSHDKAPSSWSPAAREKWNQVPEELRAEIIRREEASVNGVRKLHEEYAPVKQFAEALSPFIKEAADNGLNATQYIQNVMISERGLRNPNPEQRFNVLLNIADQYGIPLREIINQSAGKEILKTASQPQADPTILAKLEQLERIQQETQQDTYRRQIMDFKKDKEFFEDVSDIMADLMDMGRAKDLADAYDQACWAHPDVRRVLLQREKNGNSNNDLKERQAKASGASVKASGEKDIKVDDVDEDDLAAVVRAAVAQNAGRV